jgi:hypothetical protein
MNNLTKFTLAFLVIAGVFYFSSKNEEDNLLSGGKGDDLDEEDVDQDELMKGLDVEMEHTTNKNIAREIALDHLAEDPEYYTKLEAIHKENPGKTAKRTDEKLWEKVKKEAVKKMGGHSARAMQYAVKLYKDRGGEYIGKKRVDNDLATWTRADWQYAPGSKSKDRYLPKEAWDELDPEEEKATRKKKKGKLGQWVKNTKKAQKAASRATNKARRKNKE